MIVMWVIPRFLILSTCIKVSIRYITTQYNYSLITSSKVLGVRGGNGSLSTSHDTMFFAILLIELMLMASLIYYKVGQPKCFHCPHLINGPDTVHFALLCPINCPMEILGILVCTKLHIMFVLQNAGSKDDFAAKMKIETERRLQTIDKEVAANKEKVIDRLLELIYDIKPEVHINYKHPKAA